MTGNQAQGEAPLRARLRVEPHDAAGCGVLEAGERGDDVVQTGGRPGAHGECSCRAAVTVDDGEDRTRAFVESEVEEYCICPVFADVECAAEIEGFRDGALLVSVTLPRRETLRELVTALRDRQATVHLEQVLPLAADGDDDRRLTLDPAGITEKQRSALATAVELGYYERPRGADLATVAEELGISRSAASQRLNAAEATLVGALVEATDLEPAETAAADAAVGRERESTTPTDGPVAE